MNDNPRTPGFSSTQVCRETGITFRILDYWLRLGILSPSLASSAGCGTVRRFSARDVRLVRTLAFLRQLGAGTDVLRQAVRSCEQDSLQGGLLLVSPAGDTSYEPDHGWGCWWVLDLDQILAPLLPLETAAA